MKLIVISSPTPVPNEHEIINSLFKEGLEILHIHKPDLNKEQIKDLIGKIPSAHQKKVFMHSDFPKFHSLQELKEHKGKYEYAFLSPIFDSISKPGYKSKFTHRSHTSLPDKKGFSQIIPELITAVRGKNIIALGGIDTEKIELVRKVGFAGVAVLGAVWNSKDPVEKFKKIKSLCQPKPVVE
jgi:thiamine-phosphate pyrophosphorylase